jgi:hypothetical protein
MKQTIKELKRNTDGMSPLEFEAYCNNNDIKIKRLSNHSTSINDGYYNAVLVGYRRVDVFTVDGLPIEMVESTDGSMVVETNNELVRFTEYVLDFYNDVDGIYPIATDAEIRIAITDYMNITPISDIGFDSVDRERIRMILEPDYVMF